MISFPIQLDELFADIGVAEASLTPSDPRSLLETRGGSIETMNIGQWLWHGTVSVNVKHAANQRRAEAAIEVLKQAGASFLATDLRQKFPIADLSGSELGSATPLLSQIEENRQQVGVSGLPGGYKLSQGDLFSFRYGEVYALHRVVRDVVANAAGDIPALDVFPRVSINAVIGAQITLSFPVCKAVMRPGSYAPSRHLPGYADGMTFEWVQSLR